MRKTILTALIVILSALGAMAQYTAKASGKVTLYNRYGKLIYQKEGVVLKGKHLQFTDFMPQAQLDTLAGGTYFYLFEKGDKNLRGFLQKSKGEGIYTIKFTGLKVNLLNSKLYLDIDGKKIPFKGDTTIKGTEIRLKKHRFTVKRNRGSKEKMSLWCGDKEFSLNVEDKYSCINKQSQGAIDKFFNKNSSIKENICSITGFINLGKGMMQRKLYIDIDGKKMLMKDGMSIGDAKIIFRKKGFKIKKFLTYKKRISVRCGKNGKEIWHSFDPEAFFESIDITSWEDNKKDVLFHKNGIPEKRKTIVFKSKNNQPVLYVVDGVEHIDKDGFKEVSPDSIQGIHVLRKGPVSAIIFGERGKNGVVFIRTKQK